MLLATLNKYLVGCRHCSKCLLAKKWTQVGLRAKARNMHVSASPVKVTQKLAGLGILQPSRYAGLSDPGLLSGGHIACHLETSTDAPGTQLRRPIECTPCHYNTYMRALALMA